MASDELRVLPMFPLGSVLLPAMPLALRVFEQRYLELLARVLQDEPSEFGVVLIERGQEVGGGDHRFGLGTVARIVELESGEGAIGVMARGVERFEVVRWLDDAPFPRAEVRMLPELVWDPALDSRRLQVELAVRSALAEASRGGGADWPDDIALAEDPISSCWQLAGLSPVGDLDRVAFLRSPDAAALLDAVLDETVAALELLGGEWPES